MSVSSSQSGTFIREVTSSIHGRTTGYLEASVLPLSHSQADAVTVTLKGYKSTSTD